MNKNIQHIVSLCQEIVGTASDYDAGFLFRKLFDHSSLSYKQLILQWHSLLGKGIVRKCQTRRDIKQKAEEENDYTEYLKVKEELEFKDDRVEIDCNVAKIYTKNEGKSYKLKMKLKKVNGDWKVDIEK